MKRLISILQKAKGFFIDIMNANGETDISGFTAENIESAFIMGALTALEDMKDMKVPQEDRDTIRRFYTDWFNSVHK